MECTAGFFNNCNLTNYYNDPLVIIGWMIFAIVAWQLKSLIWIVVKWLLWLSLGLLCAAIFAQMFFY